MLRQGTSLNAISGLENLKLVRQLNKREKDLVKGKIVRQRSLRQKTTIFKAGTHCQKTSTEQFGSAPAQLINILFFLHRMLQLLWHIRKVIRRLSNRGRVRPSTRILTILLWTVTKKMVWMICVFSGSHNTYCWSNGYGRLPRMIKLLV